MSSLLERQLRPAFPPQRPVRPTREQVAVYGVALYALAHVHWKKVGHPYRCDTDPRHPEKRYAEARCGICDDFLALIEHGKKPFSKTVLAMKRLAPLGPIANAEFCRTIVAP